jgi:hypothetical protein
MFCSETLIVGGAILLAIEKIEHFGFILPKSDEYYSKLYMTSPQSRYRGWPAQSNHALDTVWLPI